MRLENQEGKIIYKVMVNCEDHYSIWPIDRRNPLGWRDVGKRGTKDECISYIGNVWDGMKPLLRKEDMGQG